MKELRWGPRQNNPYTKPFDLEEEYERDVTRAARKLFKELRGDVGANTKAATIVVGCTRFVVSITQVETT